MKIYQNITELIGGTPLIRLQKIMNEFNLKAELLAKTEFFNPASSIKDRAAKYLIEDAEEKGILKKDTVIIEPTSGNTGVGLALICAVKGYRLILTMPETMSMERQRLLRAFGAKLILTDGKLGMQGAIDRAEELHKEISDSIIPGQFVNPANALAHEQTTAKEILADLDNQVDIFVSAVGTGGTLTGTGRGLKKSCPAVHIVAVEPDASAVLSGDKAGAHKIQGIGAGFIPEILDTALIDEIVRVTDQEAIQMAQMLAQKEGIFTGISAGSAVCASVKLALRPENAGKQIVMILPDTGERYLSVEGFIQEK